MRLIHVEHLFLREFNSASPPPYAILSHTWGSNEVAHEAFQDGALRKSLDGWTKIQHACEQAQTDGLEWLWCDTCCIDKRSSAELSEAINSMFMWCSNASICYAYLADVYPAKITGGHRYFKLHKANTSLAQHLERLARFQDESLSISHEIGSSRWFKRGWTLQELLAQKVVHFFSAVWTHLGSKEELAPMISECTGIDDAYLSGTRPFHSASIAKRMSWASNRQTARPEDAAYCLIGIFDVNMPLLYGEGNKAFLRLQEEILRCTDDQSLFAWTNRFAPAGSSCGLLATHPSMFQDSGEIRSFQDFDTDQVPISMTNLGLSMTLPLVRQESSPGCFVARLRCFSGSLEQAGDVGILLRKLGTNSRQYARVEPNKLYSGSGESSLTQFFVRQKPSLPERAEKATTPVEMEYVGVRAVTRQLRVVGVASGQGLIKASSSGGYRFRVPTSARRLALILFLESTAISRTSVGTEAGFTIFLCSGDDSLGLAAFVVPENFSSRWSEFTIRGLFRSRSESMAAMVTSGRRVRLEKFTDSAADEPTKFWVAFDKDHSFALRARIFSHGRWQVKE